MAPAFGELPETEFTMKTEIFIVNGKPVKKTEVPMRVNLETAEVNGQNIVFRKIGGRVRPCLLVWVEEEFAKNYMQMEWADCKADERDERCLKPDGKGGFIRCPDCNKCIECEKYFSYEFDTMNSTSLDNLGVEIPDRTPDFTDSLADKEIMDQVIAGVRMISELAGDILESIRNGNERVSHIAKDIGRANSTVDDNYDKAMAIGREVFMKLMK